MNREPFKGMITVNGNYLNDAIYWKLKSIFPVNEEIIFDHPIDGAASSEQVLKYNVEVSNLRANILGFNNIVDKGEKFAREFIGEY